MAKEQNSPEIDLLVACQMAGNALLMVAGSLQERFNNDHPATELNLEAIETTAHDVLKALADYTSK